MIQTGRFVVTESMFLNMNLLSKVTRCRMVINDVSTDLTDLNFKPNISVAVGMMRAT